MYLFCLFSLISVALCSRILVYSPSISYSHLISNGRIADTLVDAGHDVTMFIPEYHPGTNHFNGTKKAKVVRMSNISSRYVDDLAGLDEFILTNERLGFLERLEFEYTLVEMCEGIMRKKEELADLKNMKFDVAFTEQIDLCGLGVLRYLGVTNILWISTTPIMDAVSYNLGIPAPVSYVPTIEENDNGDIMNFYQRAFNLYMYIGTIAVHRKGSDMSTEVFRKYVDPSFPNLREIASNSSLCFVNSDEMFDLARPILHKTIYVGGLGVHDPQPLTKEFSNIMSKGEKGVIIFSLGSIAQFHSFPASVKIDIAKVVKRLSKYHFLFKIAKDDNTTASFFKGVSNVDLVTWLPQADILAHPRLSLFIMHGGVNGLTEAMLRAVPVLIVPIFADQFRNGRNAERRGVGKVILKTEINEKNLFAVVQSILEDRSYKQNAIRIQKLMKEKPFSPAERLVKWTEFAANNGVLDNLHVQGSRFNTIVYFNLDVFAAFFAALFLVLFVIVKFIRLLSGAIRSPKKLKTN